MAVDISPRGNKNKTIHLPLINNSGEGTLRQSD